MEITWIHYYGTVRKLSLLTGMWPYQKQRTRLFHFALLITIVLSVFVPQIAFQFTCERNLQCIFESMTSYLLTTVSVVKVCTLQLNIRKIKYFTDHLFTDWKKLETAEEYEIMKSYAENCRRFSLIYPIYCCSAVCVFMSVSIVPHILDIISPLNESRQILLPYPAYYFVDNKRYYIHIFCHSLFAWEIIVIGIVTHDCMFMSYVEHVCSIFAVIGNRFEYLFCKRNNIMDDMNIDTENAYNKRLAFLVHAHREAIELAQILEDIFCIPFGIQLLINTVGISITLLQITKDASFLETIRYILYVIGQLVHLFFLSFEGHKLIDHGLQMRDRIYNSLWYEALTKSRKTIILVMIQSLRPTFLSAGKIYVFSLESFLTVLQLSMSYFTVFASFQ